VFQGVVRDGELREGEHKISTRIILVEHLEGEHANGGW